MCCLRNIATHNYQKRVSTSQTRTDREMPEKVIPMSVCADMICKRYNLSRDEVLMPSWAHAFSVRFHYRSSKFYHSMDPGWGQYMELCPNSLSLTNLFTSETLGYCLEIKTCTLTNSQKMSNIIFKIHL